MADLVARPNGGSSRGLVSELFGFDPVRAFVGTYGAGTAPTVDVQKTDDGWTLEIPVPGFRPDEIEVTVEDRVLTVSGKSERRSFQRSILLPEEVNPETIEAKVENGLLALSLHLHPKAQPRKIAIAVA